MTSEPLAGAHEAGHACQIGMVLHRFPFPWRAITGVLLVGAQTDQMPIDEFDEHIRCNIPTAFLMTIRPAPSAERVRATIA